MAAEVLWVPQMDDAGQVRLCSRLHATYHYPGDHRLAFGIAMLPAVEPAVVASILITFHKVQSRPRSHCRESSACISGRRSMLCIGSIVLLFAGCLFVSVAAAQYGNSASPGTWTNSTLIIAREWLAATSLPNDGLAIFAGGGGALCVMMSVIAGVGAWGGGGCVGGVRCAAAAAAEC
jgi:hypothetical protein